MKQLFCVVVTDPSEEVGLVSPLIFHIKSTSTGLAEDAVMEKLGEFYPAGLTRYLDLFTFEVRELDILEID